jgi:hypothetical protein
VNGAKQGGNVASYFCTPDGRVMHIVAGPVDGDTMVREARWVVDNWKLARLHGPADATRLAAYFRKAHGDRLRREYGIDLAKRVTIPTADPTAGLLASLFETPAGGRKGNINGARVIKLDRQAKVHYLLATYPLVRTGQIYEIVFEKILGERISTLPVAVRN